LLQLLVQALRLQAQALPVRPAAAQALRVRVVEVAAAVLVAVWVMPVVSLVLQVVVEEWVNSRRKVF
jgi:hypothetical protein